MKIFQLLLFAILVNNFHSQSNIVSSGSSYSNSTGSLSYSLGQIDYVYVTNASGSLYSGNQQAFEIFEAGLNENLSIKLSAFVYPNPTNNFVLLKIQEIELTNLHYTVFDTDGKEISSNNILGFESKISFTSVSTGIYFLKVYQDNSELKSFKIIKNK